MIKNFHWILLALLAIGAALWLGVAQDGGRDKVKEAGINEVRQSSRHRSGEVEKNQPTPLEKKVALQEQLVEEKRKGLLALARGRAPVLHMGVDGTPAPVETPEEAAKKAQANQDFENAKRDYLADRQLLQQLKQELAEEEAKAKKGAKSR